MTGVAVKMTGWPWHPGFEEEVMLTLTGRSVLTVMVTVLEMAVELVIQVALDVSWQVTRSPFNGV